VRRPGLGRGKIYGIFYIGLIHTVLGLQCSVSAQIVSPFTLNGSDIYDQDLQMIAAVSSRTRRGKYLSRPAKKLWGIWPFCAK
jgi:hypothetical protein